MKGLEEELAEEGISYLGGTVRLNDESLYSWLTLAVGPSR
jgi:hypothetical protein